MKKKENDWNFKKLLYNAMLTRDWPETDELAEHLMNTMPELWNGNQIVYKLNAKILYLTPYYETEINNGKNVELEHWKLDIIKA